jgi:hypothetical protein
MVLVALAWTYVVLMMAVVEATSNQGTLLGAVFTLLLYGALPLGIVLYVMNTPARRRARRMRESEAARTLPPEGPASVAPQPDGGGHAAGDAVAPVREEP